MISPLADACLTMGETLRDFSLPSRDFALPRHPVQLYADDQHVDVVARILMALDAAVRDVAEAPAGDDAVARVRMERDADAALGDEVDPGSPGGHAVARV